MPLPAGWLRWKVSTGPKEHLLGWNVLGVKARSWVGQYMQGIKRNGSGDGMHSNELHLLYLYFMTERASRSLLRESHSSSTQLTTTLLLIVEDDNTFLNSSRLLRTSLSSGERSLPLISLVILAILRDLTLSPIRSSLVTAILSKISLKSVVCSCRRYLVRNLSMSPAKLSIAYRARLCRSFFLVGQLPIVSTKRANLPIWSLYQPVSVYTIKGGARF